MDVIPIFGEEGEDHLGLILEHQADSETKQFEELVEDMKRCLHHLGWSYDGWIGEDVEQVMVH